MSFVLEAKLLALILGEQRSVLSVPVLCLGDKLLLRLRHEAAGPWIPSRASLYFHINLVVTVQIRDYAQHENPQNLPNFKSSLVTFPMTRALAYGQVSQKQSWPPDVDSGLQLTHLQS